MSANTSSVTYPDYSNSILGIPNALLAHYGAAVSHTPLPVLETVLKESSCRHVALMVFDGMGSDMLAHHLPANAFLNRHKIADILSVYPCTTTAAITTFESGLSPIEHGWLGWSCYFKEIWRCVDLFSGNASGITSSLPAANQHMAYSLLPYDSLFDRIKRGANAPDEVCRISPFGAYKADSCGEICSYMKALCAEPGRKFLNTYHFQPDHDMHDYGSYDERVRFMMAGFNAMLEALCAKLQDTLVIITADHGMRDIKMLCIEDYPHLQECLALPISVEPRCASLFLCDAYREQFPQRFKDTFGEAFRLFTKEEALSCGLFGPGAPHPKALDFLGDYIAVATGDYAIWQRDNKGDYNDFKASHAGLDTREMMVPLIIVST